MTRRTHSYSEQYSSPLQHSAPGMSSQSLLCIHCLDGLPQETRHTYINNNMSTELSMDTTVLLWLNCTYTEDITQRSWANPENRQSPCCQILHSIVSKPKIHYQFHKSPSLLLILSHVHLVHVNRTCFFKIHFNIFLRTSRFPCWSLSTKTVYLGLPSHLYLPKTVYLDFPSDLFLIKPYIWVFLVNSISQNHISRSS
jgi:hypothetical protein